MAVMDGCESQHRTSVIEERVCPKCGKEVEVFTSRGNAGIKTKFLIKGGRTNGSYGWMRKPAQNFSN